MEISLRRLIPTGLVLLLDTGLTVSGYVNTTLAYFLWALMIPAALYSVWPWIKRIRVGLAPPDTELREAKDAQKRLFGRVKGQQQEIQALNKVRKRQLEKIRELEQERDELRAELGANRAPNHSGNTVVPDAVSPGTVDRLKARIEELGTENEELAARLAAALGKPGAEQLSDEELKQRCIQVSETLSTFLKNRRGSEKAYQGTVAAYRRRYGAEVAVLFDELERRNWLAADHRRDMEQVFTPQGITQVANWLSMIGHSY